MIDMTLKAPLFTDWTEQYVRLHLGDTAPGTPLVLTVDGQLTDFQYTGEQNAEGAEILLKLGFARDETKKLEFAESAEATTCLERVPLPLKESTCIGFPNHELSVGAAAPFLGFADSAMTSAIHCETTFEGAELSQVNDGPLFTDYELEYHFAENRRYTLQFRCYRNENYIEVTETFSLGMNSELVWTLNPEKKFTHIISRDSFEGESQPTVEPLGENHPRDVLCRLQMPVLTEYFIPNNRGWFAFFDERDEPAGMIGILGLYGAKWENPVASMPEILDRQGMVEWHASLESGKRHWLLYAGPVEVRYSVISDQGTEGSDQSSVISNQGTGESDQSSVISNQGTGESDQSSVISGQGTGGSDQSSVISGQGRGESDQSSVGGELTSKPITDNRSQITDVRFVFHRLHAEFNALRLDEHLDLDGEKLLDATCARAPGVLPDNYRERARRTVEALPCLQHASHPTLAALLAPEPTAQQALSQDLFGRFEKWVRQFQGYRTGENDYAKNVIGFSRRLRGMLIAYELLRRDNALSDEQARKLNSYFAFAARRILDEGRWPHSRTWLHPDHPESTRNFYTYGGEHAPDRLVWTNSLPNFQSDPMCALAHLSALFKDHPDARFWRRFALEEIDRQLDAYCGKSGAWEESINYALYTLSYFVITFKAVKERCGIDYFSDERVRRYVSWLCRFFGPYDKRFGCHTWPAIGNSVLPQNQAEYLLCYANELADEDPLRTDCLVVWNLCAEHCRPSEHYPVVMAAMAPEEECSVFGGQCPGGRQAEPTAPTDQSDLPRLKALTSEVMDEVGVSMRHRHTEPDESYLFQKIGFAKDHYEDDESAFNWYAKGTPLCMDYGTYTPDVGIGGAHNLVEIPDEDPLRRGYLADHLFTDALDYTRCEMPVVLKLLWGKVRTFAEVEAQNGKVHRDKPPYFYIGDNNPVGPKVWKVRQLLFVKPDYTVLFDRVYGRVPHRYNLHVTGTDIQVSSVGVQGSEVEQGGQPITGHRSLITGNGALITAKGRFDLDLLAYVQHPAEFELETGELIPKLRNTEKPADEALKHSQHYFRLHNQTDGIYRTLLFAKERGREVRVETAGENGIKVVTLEYTDYIFAHNDWIEERGDDFQFSGRAGWIRHHANGRIEACVPDGDRVAAFGVTLQGRGPWSYDDGNSKAVTLHGGPPRVVDVQ